MLLSRTHEEIKLCCGLTLTAFGPVSPAVTPAPESVIQSAKDTKSEIIQCVPSFAEVFHAVDRDFDVLTFAGMGTQLGPRCLSQDAAMPCECWQLLTETYSPRSL